MSMILFLRILLVLHLCGLAIMMGTTTVDYFTFKFFCSVMKTDARRAQGFIPVMSRYGELVRLGAAVLIFTGIAMLALAPAWWEQLWFKIKMGLVVLLVLNGVFIGNSLGSRFRKIVTDNITLLDHTPGIKTGLNCFYLVQLSIFLLIVIVSIVRPMQSVIK